MDWAYVSIENIWLAEGRRDVAVDGDADSSLDGYIGALPCLSFRFCMRFSICTEY